MNSIKYMLAVTLLCASASHAEENNEVLIDAIEVSHFMVNWSPNSENLGRVIMARCPECAPETMTFDKHTELFINNKSYPIEQIGSKTDWAGLITVTNQEPSKIIKFTIYPSQPGE
jgi:RNA polymerase subunit RPABC4/transcription elongation factor Spt4